MKHLGLVEVKVESTSVDSPVWVLSVCSLGFLVRSFQRKGSTTKIFLHSLAYKVFFRLSSSNALCYFSFLVTWLQLVPIRHLRACCVWGGTGSGQECGGGRGGKWSRELETGLSSHQGTHRGLHFSSLLQATC